MEFNRSQCWRAAGEATIKGRETPGDHVVAAATGPPDELLCVLWIVMKIVSCGTLSLGV